MAAKTDAAGRRVAKKNEPPLAALAEKDITSTMDRYASWIKAQTGYDVDPKSVQLAGTLRSQFQKSDENQAALADAKQRNIDEAEAREQRKLDRAAAREQRETERAARAEERAAAKEARAAAKAAEAAEPKAKPAAKAKTAAAAPAKTTRRRAPKPAANAAETDF